MNQISSLTQHKVSDKPQYGFRHVVMQPTTTCNLNCQYCYLPYRKTSDRMKNQVSRAVAASIAESPHHITIVWHGGEPLACGLEAFRQLVEPFSELRCKGKITHNIQTNATLIDQKWCDFFRAECFGVGVSLDGPRSLNRQRVTWGNRESYDSVLRGIESLQKNSLDFGVIAVVNPGNIDSPDEFYDFFVSLGCTRLSVNVEEREGLNKESKGVDRRQVQIFWERLFSAWKANPVIRIREFDRALGWMQTVSNGKASMGTFIRDFWPTVSYSGDVVVLSPEFMSVTREERANFVVGNVLSAPLTEIVRNSIDCWYVHDYFIGVEQCRKNCTYYSYCGGGEASNKYFELGDICATETDHCRNSRQSVVDAILYLLQ